MWMILAILFMSTSFIQFMINSKKNEHIKALEYAIIKGASDEVLMKAVEEYKRYKQ